MLKWQRCGCSDCSSLILQQLKHQSRCTEKQNASFQQFFGAQRMWTVVITANPPRAVLCDWSLKCCFPPSLFLPVLSGDKVGSIPVVARSEAPFRTGCVALVEKHSINFALEEPPAWANTMAVRVHRSPWTAAAQRNHCFALTWNLLYSNVSNMANVKLFVFFAELRGWKPQLFSGMAVGLDLWSELRTWVHFYLEFLSGCYKRNEFSNLSRKGRTFGHWTTWTFLLLVWHNTDRSLSKVISSMRINCEKRNANKEKEFIVFNVVLLSPPISILGLNGRGLRWSG